MRERIRRQIAQRTEMLAGVSHDLRTPLTRMRLALELFGEDETVNELKADILHMQRMIEAYLDFARGEGTEPPREADLVPLITTIAETLRRGGGEISLALPAEAVLPLRPDAMRRCLANLMENAARYGRHVWVTLIAVPNGVDILIDDDGPGIPEAQRETAFRAFVRLDPARSPTLRGAGKSSGGTGLGLTIARDVARGHGGDIFLENSPQGGLRVRLHLLH